jgi:CMP-N-acetylneuraminic acid synthetase
LIVYSIKAALESKYIDDLIVSTDEEDIAKISKEFHAEVPFMRPREISQDKSTSEEAILHCINWCAENNKKYDVFILLQPTSPLRNSNHINEALEVFFRFEGANTLYSVVEVKNTPFKMKIMNGSGFLSDFSSDYKSAKRRQDYPKLYHPNGAIYISKIDVFTHLGGFDESKLIPYIMNSTASIDIDDEIDFQLAELIMKSKIVS